MGLAYSMHLRSTPVPPQARTRTQELAFGRDLKFAGDYEVAPGGDYVQVEGLAALRQAVYLALITEPGSYKYRPNYGVGIMAFVGKPATSARLEELRARIIGGLQRLRRIEQVKEVAVEQTDSYTVKVNLLIIAAGRTVRFNPFEFRRP
jgi:phage baseplate assembly protein W